LTIRNKARLVVQGHTKEEGIDYDEVFAPVARIEAIRLFLAYASFMGFIVYQMDVKSAFLYGTIKEEVYVYQPLGFEDLNYLDKVYKVVKALYGLYQAPRALYETLANYLLKNGFQRGKIDQTLFIKKKKGDILLVRVYVDDIIFGSTNKELCKAFERLMKDKFQMSSMEELTFFLGLQVKQKDVGIFISQDKYVAKILRKFSFTDVKLASTPIEIEKPLLKDPDGGCQFLGCRLISWQCKKHIVVATSSTKAEYVAAASFCAQVLWIQNSLVNAVEGFTISFDQIIDFLNAHTIQYALVEIFAELARMGYEKPPPKLTFYKAFFSAQWKFLIHILVCMVRNVDSPSKFLMYLCFLQVVINNQVDDLTSHSTRYTSLALTQKVAELEQDKHTQALEILKLKKRVKKLEKKNRSKHSGFKRLRKVKYPIIDWEVHTESLRTYWKIIRCPVLITRKLYGLNYKDYLNQMQMMYYGSFKEFRFCIDSKSINKVSVIVVLDLSKVAKPLFSLTDKDLFKSKDLHKTRDLHQHLLRLCSQRLETASPVQYDDVTTHLVMASQSFMMASAHMAQPKI
nr:putative ribonuclease H-like domain-containing protein [Tanacetum cinerariifolium]